MPRHATPQTGLFRANPPGRGFPGGPLRFRRSRGERPFASHPASRPIPESPRRDPVEFFNGLLTFGQQLQGLPDCVGYRQVSGQLLHGGGPLPCRCSRAPAAPGAHRPTRPQARRRQSRRKHRLALEFEQQALGGFLADARDFDDAADFLRGDRRRQVVDRQAGQHRQGGLGANAGHFQQFAKRRALDLAAEP